MAKAGATAVAKKVATTVSMKSWIVFQPGQGEQNKMVVAKELGSKRGANQRRNLFHANPHSASSGSSGDSDVALSMMKGFLNSAMGTEIYSDLVEGESSRSGVAARIQQHA